MKHILQLDKMRKYAEKHGLKYLRIGTLELEFSDIELANQYATKIGAVPSATQLDDNSSLTSANTDSVLPSPIAEASPTAIDDQDDEALLFHSSI